MFAQIGNIVLKGVNSFSGLSRKESTTYAQHDIIAQKSVLQPISNDLEEISIAFHLHSKIANVESIIVSFKKCKEDFEVMPFVLGNGRYLGDYVIIDVSETITSAFPDGTIIEADLQITLKEFVGDRTSQIEQKKRKNALAVDKRPSPMTVPQKLNPARLFLPNINTIKALSDDSQILSDRWIADPQSSNYYSYKISDNMDGISESIRNSENLLEGSSTINILNPAFNSIKLKLQEVKNVISDTADRSRIIKEIKTLTKDIYSLSYPQITAALTRKI